VKSLTAIDPSETRPQAPGRKVSLRSLATFSGCLLLGYACVDMGVFRSGFYARFLDPDKSATGYVERSLYDEINRKPSGRKEVLVVGNSRIAEGFSAKIANERQSTYWFSNFGVSATGDRVWYYLVRDVDPHRNRYDAIALTIDDYDDPDDYEDVADRASEMPLLVNRLGLGDMVPYTRSYTSWKSRVEVFRGLALPEIVYQRDFQDFMEHPIRRVKRIAEYRATGAKYSYDYGGLQKSLAGLEVDYRNQRIVFPAGMPENQRQELTGMFFSRPAQRGRIRAFEVRWLGALVDLYRGSKTKIVIFQAPRNPAPKPPLVHLPWTTVDELRKRRYVRVIDQHAFEDLEKPELFADHVHLNASGRKIFSPRFAERVKESLQ